MNVTILEVNSAKKKLPTYLWLYVPMQDFSIMYVF